MQEIVSRIPRQYVNDDFGYAQVMIPYSRTLSIFGKEGLIFNDDPKYDFVNRYLEQDFRTAFPYHNIPNHIRRQGWFGRVNVTNQLFKFDEHYITVGDGVATDRCVLLDKDEALIMTKVLPANINNTQEYSNKSVTMTRDELDAIFKPSSENEKVYICTTNGELYHGSNMGYMEENHFLKTQREKYQNQLNRICDDISEDTVEFIQRKINEMTLDDLRDYPLPPSLYLIKMDGANIKIQLIYSHMVRSNEYVVTIKNLPLDKYVLEQFKFMAPNIVELKEPKISLRLNPGVTQADIQEAKEMVLRMKNRN